MKNTLYDPFPGVHLPPEYLKSRMQKIILQELSPLQRQALCDHYFRNMTVSEIAAARGVHKSTVSRTLRRAENRLRRLMEY